MLNIKNQKYPSSALLASSERAPYGIQKNVPISKLFFSREKNPVLICLQNKQRPWLGYGRLDARNLRSSTNNGSGPKLQRRPEMP